MHFNAVTTWVKQWSDDSRYTRNASTLCLYYSHMCQSSLKHSSEITEVSLSHSFSKYMGKSWHFIYLTSVNALYWSGLPWIQSLFQSLDGNTPYLRCQSIKMPSAHTLPTLTHLFTPRGNWTYLVQLPAYYWKLGGN